MKLPHLANSHHHPIKRACSVLVKIAGEAVALKHVAHVSIKDVRVAAAERVSIKKHWVCT